MLELLYLDAQTYKLGLRGNVYVMRGDDWIRSYNMTEEQFNIQLKKQNKKADPAVSI